MGCFPSKVEKIHTDSKITTFANDVEELCLLGEYTKLFLVGKAIHTMFENANFAIREPVPFITLPTFPTGSFPQGGRLVAARGEFSLFSIDHQRD